MYASADGTTRSLGNILHSNRTLAKRNYNSGATILAMNYLANCSGRHVRRYSIRLGSSNISRDSCATCIPPSLPARPCIC
ncbi:uncharacterized protein LAESUDRAFT_307437 [Laetiporus sulphureus 93-53]|uniref:Uncharacterized protein n=1 Tax=Laetiporus sulphureus 93-53 TaxID=1314785 RepID=A0A165D9G9_9APHY|nr:uncharacterized protein LAESUDRAFT_307437 [Laetiporus sulphureus 93-53]KZT04383.1 hypothetical protein LAESUDRAFT_307437 [Laetiporus sulphureus 93-53]